MLPKWAIIAIIVVCVLIALYIVYLVGSNRRFHRMCDPQIEALRQYEEARHRANHAEPGTPEDYVPQDPKEQSADYSWKE